MVDRLSGSHDSLVQKWIQHVQHADALKGLENDHSYAHSSQLSLPPEAAATMSVTQVYEDSESSKSPNGCYNSPLEVPSPCEGNAVFILHG